MVDVKPWFRAIPVAPELTRELSTAWTVHSDAAHDLVPDACVDIV